MHYHFVTREKMLEMIAAGEFIEHAEVGVWPNDSQFGSVAGSAAWAVQVHTNFYGTSKAAVSSVSDSGRICILDIDIQGVKAVKALPDFGAQCDFASNHARRPLRLAAQRSDLLSASSS